MFEFEVEDVSKLPEEQRGFYEKTADGKYQLKVNGAVPKSKLEEFRNNNIELIKKLEPYKDVDLGKFKELLEQDRKVREKQLIDAGKVEEVVQERVKVMREELEGKVGTLAEQNSAMTRQLELLLVDNAVKGAAVTSGVLSVALDDVILRAKTVFKIENGVPVAKDDKSQVIYGEDGKTPLSVDSWVKMLKKTAPHLFAGFNGSGAAGGNNPGGKDLNKMSSVEKISMGLGAR
jgi:hypothetical protein